MITHYIYCGSEMVSGCYKTLEVKDKRISVLICLKISSIFILLGSYFYNGWNICLRIIGMIYRIPVLNIYRSEEMEYTE